MTKTPRRNRRLPAPKKRAARSTPSRDKASKLSKVITALRSPKGATIPALMHLTGWQAHSVRGALSGALKKDRGFIITSEKTGAERVYRIEARR